MHFGKVEPQAVWFYTAMSNNSSGISFLQALNKMNTLEINVLPNTDCMALPVDLKKTPKHVGATWLFMHCIINLGTHHKKNRGQGAYKYVVFLLQNKSGVSSTKYRNIVQNKF